MEAEYLRQQRASKSDVKAARTTPTSAGSGVAAAALVATSVGRDTADEGCDARDGTYQSSWRTPGVRWQGWRRRRDEASLLLRGLVGGGWLGLGGAGRRDQSAGRAEGMLGGWRSKVTWDEVLRGRWEIVFRRVNRGM